jgi:hypothetical protein
MSCLIIPISIKMGVKAASDPGLVTLNLSEVHFLYMGSIHVASPPFQYFIHITYLYSSSVPPSLLDPPI